MGVVDLFRPVSVLPRERVLEWLRNRHPDTFLLIDVRQPEEFARGHLPGALSIPVWELPERLETLDKGLPVIVYCRFGLRSRAAAGMMQRAGFTEIHTLEGGFEVWEGEKASGLPDQALVALSTDSTEKLIAAAWMLEDGTEKFYRKISAACTDPKVSVLFDQLALAESQHKKTLSALYEAFSGKGASSDFAPGVLGLAGDEAQRIEGGISFQEACAWAEGRDPLQLIEIAIAIETNAYDRCLALRRILADENMQRVLEILAGDERRHLKRLLEAYRELAEFTS